MSWFRKYLPPGQLELTVLESSLVMMRECAVECGLDAGPGWLARVVKKATPLQSVQRCTSNQAVYTVCTQRTQTNATDTCTMYTMCTNKCNKQIQGDTSAVGSKMHQSEATLQPVYLHSAHILMVRCYAMYQCKASTCNDAPTEVNWTLIMYTVQ